MSATHYLPLRLEDPESKLPWAWAIAPDGERVQVFRAHLLTAAEILQHNDGSPDA